MQTLLEKVFILRVRLKRRHILELLLRRNMTQKELATMAGLGPSHLSQLLKGDRPLSADVRRRLMDALAPADFDDLFEVEEGPDVR